MMAQLIFGRNTCCFEFLHLPKASACANQAFSPSRMGTDKALRRPVSHYQGGLAQAVINMDDVEDFASPCNIATGMISVRKPPQLVVACADRTEAAAFDPDPGDFSVQQAS